MTPILKEIYDIQRLHHKIALGRLNPLEFVNLHESYQKIVELYGVIKGTQLKSLFKEEIYNKLRKFMKYYNSIFDLTELNKYLLNEITGTVYKPNIHSKIDEYQNLIMRDTEILEEIRNRMDCYVEAKRKKDYLNDDVSTGQDKNLIHLIFHENSDFSSGKKKIRRYFLKTTDIRCKQLKKNLSKVEYIKISDDLTIKTSSIIYDKLKSGVRIMIPCLDNISSRLAYSTEDLQNEITKLYKDDLFKIYKNWGLLFEELTNTISEIDFLNGGAICAIRNKYSKPEITKSEKSFIKVKKIRHPIIEKIISHAYVPHSLNLGIDETDGMLLYGLNSAGKSSLMKSIGLNVILAQIGYFVAAEKFEFSPYHSIFTRIVSTDNIYKGLSSFAYELEELDAILKRSGSQTLVLADEVCKGTEHKSALVIVSTMIKMLIDSHTSFISATHLHELMDIKIIKSLKSLKIKHLSISYDDNNNKIYDRLLKDGNGSTEYGLDFAKHIIRNSSFLKITNSVKNELEKKTSLVAKKTSRYNSEVYVTKCDICGSNDKLETHHIEFQKNCDEHGFILKSDKSHIHKNHKSNLVVLCDSCHDKTHNNTIVIKGYEKTDSGDVLRYDIKDTDEKKVKNNKFDKKVIDFLQNVKEDNAKLTRVKAKNMLKKEMNVKISLSTISKIWNRSYSM